MTFRSENIYKKFISSKPYASLSLNRT